MKLSAIIVNHNQKYFPRMCIEALKKGGLPAEHELIVVDNASKDESLPYLEKMAEKKEIKLVKSGRNLGYGKGNNLGVKEAEGEFLLILNPDVFVQEGAVEKMVEYLAGHEEIGILGPKIIYHNGRVQESCRRFMTFTDLVIKRTFLRKLPRFKERLRKYVMEDFDHEKIQEVDLLVGACFLMRKSTFKRLGGFDKRYFLFMEDFDLCQKAHKEGLKVVYYPPAVVTHFHKRLSDGSLVRLFFRPVFWHHVVSSIKYFWRWRGKR